jgi:GT2 family glycosyltransferase
VIPNLVIPTLVRYDLLEKCLASIDFPVRDLIIIDNGDRLVEVSKPDTVKRMRVLSMPNNLGVAASWNLAVKCFPFDDRWFICSDDVQFSPGGLQSWFEQSSADAVVLSDEWPFFQLFSVGESVVHRVGLFDENYFPANFEDDDFEWRCKRAGVEVRRVKIAHSHVKQGTVHFGGVKNRNAETYPLNEAYYRGKMSAGDVSAGQWSLERRRNQQW